MVAIVARFARKEDLEQIRDLFVEVVNGSSFYNELARSSEVEKWTVEMFSEHLFDDPYSLIVAERGDEIVGLCITSIDCFLLWIDWVCVSVSARRSGIAQKLIAVAQQRAQNSHFHKIWCESLISNIPSVALFKTLGFRQSETFFQHWYGQDFCFLEKLLPQKVDAAG